MAETFAVSWFFYPFAKFYARQFFQISSPAKVYNRNFFQNFKIYEDFCIKTLKIGLSQNSMGTKC